LYTVETKDFNIKNLDEWELEFDFHSVYILENGKHAYIGETNDIERRAVEHENAKSKHKKYKFTRIHIINGELAEGTPAQHFERLLIKLMRADNMFRIVNGNDGKKTIYPRKNQFEAYFDDLWFLLEEKGLVKTKKFQTIMDSGVYKYSPYSALTEKQHKALTIAVNVINSKETEPENKRRKARPILINGDAGTGKTVVATSLFYHLKNDERYKDKKIALVYASTATRGEVQNVFRRIEGLRVGDVISPVEVTYRYYDIVICDEAHRLRRKKNIGKYHKPFQAGNERLGLDPTCDELDWLLKNSGCQIFFYDDKQIACPSDIPYDSFMGRINEKNRGQRPVRLDEQMRINAGDKYVPYIYDVLQQKAPVVQAFENYEFKMFSDLPLMIKLIYENDDKMGLCRLCGGYAWKWMKPSFDIVVDGVNLLWNSQTKGWLSNLDKKRELGSIYTLAGLDLNYAGVIIGPDIYYDPDDDEIKVNKNEFYDDKVKIGSSDEDIKKYILNVYAVLLTRGIKGTFVYVCDENLREYLRRVLFGINYA